MQTSTRNSLLLKRSLAAVWHPCTQMKQHESLPLIPVARAQGCWLYDFDGKRYLDAVSSWWVNLFGHGNAYINAGYPNAPAANSATVFTAAMAHQRSKLR